MNPYNYQMDCPPDEDVKCWDSKGCKTFLNDLKI